MLTQQEFFPHETIPIIRTGQGYVHRDKATYERRNRPHTRCILTREQRQKMVTRMQQLIDNQGMKIDEAYKRLESEGVLTDRRGRTMTPKSFRDLNWRKQKFIEE